jgi:8-oxo-dGTP pyrophosphatase MutT (NUDIX family)
LIVGVSAAGYITMPTVSNWIRQAAAIPVKDGRVCLVTSSSGKRWVIPKGLIDPGKTAGEMALQEAWEEAGLVGTLLPEPVGSYVYEKWGGTYFVTVFLLQVTEVLEEWPERMLRERSWLSPTQALERIDDSGLREVVRRALMNGNGEKR